MKDITSITHCSMCLNSFIDDELDKTNDFSSFVIAYTPDYNMFLTTGNGEKTKIEVLKYNRYRRINEPIIEYTPHYCPNCGRKLIENEIS